MKRIAGRTDVEDGLQRLDVLTKEENLMTAVRNLEITHRVDANVMTTQELTHRVDDKVTTIEEVIHDVCDNVITIDDNVKVTRHGAQIPFRDFRTFHPPMPVIRGNSNQ